MQALAALPGVTGVVRSRWYSSAPFPPSDQPRYVNGVVRARTSLSPYDLLVRMQAIEQQFGRVRGAANAARTLDLDIIDVDGLVVQTASLTLPHPRAHLRRFVLMPLRDVAPGWRHPVSGSSVHDQLAGLPVDDLIDI